MCKLDKSKCSGASKYLRKLNQEQTYLWMKTKKSRRFAESRLVCVDL